MGFFGIRRKFNPEKYYSISFNAKELYYTQFFDIVDLSKLVREPSANYSDFALTQLDIQFLNVPFTTTRRQLVKLLGKPQYVKAYQLSSSCEFRIYFYKKRFFKNNVIVQFYFVNDIFAYCIVTFLTLDTADEKKLIGLLNSKYLDSGASSQSETSIRDKNGYYVYYENAFYSSLVYINNSLVVREALSHDERQIIHLKKWQRHYDDWKDSL
jgi:hypothetical protein